MEVLSKGAPMQSLTRVNILGPLENPHEQHHEHRFFKGSSLYTKVDCLRELRRWLFSVQSRLREHTFTILLPTRTTRHSWAIQESMQQKPVLVYTNCLYMLSCKQPKDYADYADETIRRDYAKLRHNYALQARGYASNLIEPVPSYPVHT